jgi:hypothetical protein
MAETKRSKCNRCGKRRQVDPGSALCKQCVTVCLEELRAVWRAYNSELKDLKEELKDLEVSGLTLKKSLDSWGKKEPSNDL